MSLVNFPPTEYILEMVVVRAESTFDYKSNTQLKNALNNRVFFFSYSKESGGEHFDVGSVPLN